MKIKRYDVTVSKHLMSMMHRSNDGEWVKYEDVQNQLTEKDALIERLKEYAAHDSKCDCSNIVAGEPREDGYYHLVRPYRGREYWVDDYRKINCTCGLSDIIGE